MSFSIENRTYGYADINLFDGSRKCLAKGESFPLKHNPTEAEKRYYSKLNCIGIYMVEKEDEVSVDPVVPAVSEGPIQPAVSEESVVGDFTEEVSEDIEGEGPDKDYTKESVNDLMKLRQAELIEIAHKLGHEEVNTDFSKKEIVKLIRGE